MCSSFVLKFLTALMQSHILLLSNLLCFLDKSVYENARKGEYRNKRRKKTALCRGVLFLITKTYVFMRLAVGVFPTALFFKLSMTLSTGFRPLWRVLIVNTGVVFLNLEPLQVDSPQALLSGSEWGCKGQTKETYGRRWLKVGSFTRVYKRVSKWESTHLNPRV